MWGEERNNIYISLYDYSCLFCISFLLFWGIKLFFFCLGMGFFVAFLFCFSFEGGKEMEWCIVQWSDSEHRGWSWKWFHNLAPDKASWFGANYFTSLSLNFLIWKVKIIPLLYTGHYYYCHCHFIHEKIKA